MLMPLRNFRLLSITASHGPAKAGHYRAVSVRAVPLSQELGRLTSATNRLLNLNPDALNWSYNWSIVFSSDAFRASRRSIGTSGGRCIPGTPGCPPGSPLTAWRPRNSNSAAPRFPPARRSRGESAADRRAHRRHRRPAAGTGIISCSRYWPMASKCSKPNPIGSISRWHDAQVGFSTCSTINCRRPFGF